MTGQEGPSCLLLAYCARPLAARNAATYQHSTPHTDTRANQSHLGPLSSLDPKAPGRFLLRQSTPAGEPAAGATVRAAISVQSQSASARQAGGQPLKTKGKSQKDTHSHMHRDVHPPPPHTVTSARVQRLADCRISLSLSFSACLIVFL